ncbi:hypothetical protein AVEN_57791-1 [Araneus ventricosus]|uniref:RNase H type-1 domain-containing protein n=1 Tax=Araneus ventricosus TaxID=182803 RepID=A0A4Y2LR35_ARAVE|nr:hypothetical protein AVEN_57791-1 [Araneus ventricosus]
MESIQVSVGCLKKDLSWEATNLNEIDFQHPLSPLQIHLVDFDLDSRISLDGQLLPSDVEIFTDGSKLDGEAGCTFCAFEDITQIYQWTAKIQPFNLVFQAELLALNKAAEWTNPNRILGTIWSDSKSSLQELSSFHSRLKVVQDTQFESLKNPLSKIRLR